MARCRFTKKSNKCPKGKKCKNLKHVKLVCPK